MSTSIIDILLINKIYSSYYRALASSAPIWQFTGMINCFSYNQILTAAFNSSSPTCVENIKKSWDIIFKFTHSGILITLNISKHLCCKKKLVLILLFCYSDLCFWICKPYCERKLGLNKFYSCIQRFSKQKYSIISFQRVPKNYMYVPSNKAKMIIGI